MVGVSSKLRGFEKSKGLKKDLERVVVGTSHFKVSKALRVLRVVVPSSSFRAS